MIKVGLVGIGAIGELHYNKHKNVVGSKVVAVCDIREEMAKEKVKDDDVKVYGSLEAMLENEELDMVDICTPTYMHADMAVYALSKGVHVLCEKPMALNSDDAKRMAEAAKKTDKKFMIAHVVRFMKPYTYIKSVVESGELGKPLFADFKRISTIPTWSWEDWMRDRSKSGGSLLDLSIHDIDFVQYTFGMPKAARCAYQKLKDNNDYVDSQLIYDGFVANVTGTFFNYDIPFTTCGKVVFDKGYIYFDGGKVIKNGEEINLDENAGKIENAGLNLTSSSGHQAEIQYFVDCIINDVEPNMVTTESAVNTINIIEMLLDNCTEL